MTRIKKHTSFGVVISAVIFAIAGSGCAHRTVVHERVVTVPSHTVVVTEPPPVPHTEIVGQPPTAQHVWIQGYYVNHDGRYTWVPGHWEVRPRPGARWVPGHWNHTRRGYVWVEGYWR